MALSFDVFAMALLLAPFVAALLAPALERHTGRAAGWVLALVPAGVFAALLATLPEVAAGRAQAFAIDWVPVLGLRLSLLIDGLSLIFALLISGIGVFILIYSGEYLGEHPQRGRFLAAMLLFMGAMLGLVLADSLVALFAFWELTSIASFLLIGFEHERMAARRAAIQALAITSGLGGLALVAGGVLLHVVSGVWELSALADSPLLRMAGGAYPWVVGFVVVAAFTKSAQVPLHFWLPNAMEAPTPVSAFLHSATMVQAGVYLLARLSPLLAGTPLWQGLLCGFGGASLLWGALLALKQTDLKQLLAQTTLASLGLMVMLLGIGGEKAALAVAAYFVAHALYKAALFLVAGIIEHGTGTRDITELGGLRDTLTISFIAAGVAGLSMFGVPPLLGYLAKEEIYAALHLGDGWAMVAVGVLVVGNALLGAAALALVIRPFLGAVKPTPRTQHEGGLALWIGPALFGLASLAVVFAVTGYGELVLTPMAGAIVGAPVASHLGYAVDLSALPIWLSVCTWGMAVLIYLRLDWVRGVLLGAERRVGWSWDRGFDQAMFGLIRLAGAWTRALQHGRLEYYLIMLVAALVLVLFVPTALLGGWPALPAPGGMQPYEWGAVALAVGGIAAVVAARTRLGAIVALGVQGTAVGLIFLFFGAPDLAFTQLMVEALSVVIFTLVMTRLHLSARDDRVFEDLARDGTLAVLAGMMVCFVLLRVLEGTLDLRLSDFFVENSVPIAHGHNIVNVILVDFRGLDTLGEITVVMTAGIAVLALLRRRRPRDGAAP